MDQDEKNTVKSENLNDIRVEELFDLDDIQRMQDLFSGAAGVASLITAVDGRPLTRPSNFCRFYTNYILTQENGLTKNFRLQPQDEPLSASLKEKTISNDHGFLDAIARITVRGRHVANWLIGQVRTKDVNLQWMMEFSDNLGADRNKVIEALNEVPVMTIQQFGKVSEMLVAFANELARNATATQLLKLQVAEKEKAVKSLNESFQRNKALLDAIPDLIFMFDSDGRFLDFHAEKTDTLFVDPEFFLGKKPDEVLPHELAMLANRSIKAVHESGKPDYWTYKLEIRGDLRYYESRSVPYSNGQVLCIARDITDLRRSTEQKRESEERYLTVLNASPDNITITDLEGRVTMFSPVAIKMFGYIHEEDYLGHPVFEFIHPEHRERAANNVALMFQGTMTGPAEYLGLRNDGSTFYIEVNAEFIRGADKLPKQIVFICRDVTERKNAELRQAEMFIKIEEAREKAEAGNRLKTAFMNNISHEIRTPLNGILGFTDLVTQPDISEEEKERFCSLIKASSNRLLGTITNYMDISLIASGTTEVKSKPFNLNRFLNLLFEQSKPVCNEKNLDLRLKIPVQAKAVIIDSDPEIIHKIMSHLIDNAVKFTQRGEISFGYELNKGICTLFVKDSGIGIGKDSLSAIFESFVQEKLSSTSGHEGSGLGLSIAQGMVNLLGSKIEVESEKHSGSRFFFKLPFNESADEQLSKPAVNHAMTSARSQLILIAEDDDANFELSHAMLRKSNVKVIRARNGSEAVAQCRANPEISLVLMDLKMPGLDGLQATREIKLFRKSLLIIAITAFALSGDEKRAIEAGCDDYIAKPVVKEVLLGKLRRYGIGM